MNDIDRELANITPRAASVTLLLFDRVVARYESEFGRRLTESERTTIVALLRKIASSEAIIDD
jgi:hypothetical protein